MRACDASLEAAPRRCTTRNPGVCCADTGTWVTIPSSGMSRTKYRADLIDDLMSRVRQHHEQWDDAAPQDTVEIAPTRRRNLEAKVQLEGPADKA